MPTNYLHHGNSSQVHGSRASSKNEYAAKIAKIQQVLDQPNVDLWKLRGLALSEGGLVNGKFIVKLIKVGLMLLDSDWVLF